MLDRLMRRSVFAQADGIMRHHMDDAYLNDGGQPNRRTEIIREDEDRPRIGNESAMQGDAVHGRGHAVLAYAIMDEGSGIIARRNLGMVFRLGEVGGRQTRRTAEGGGKL